MNIRYIDNLYKQYCDANGIDYYSSNHDYDAKDFIDWIYKNKERAFTYKHFLIASGYDDFDTSAEIGKGLYDSIVCRFMDVISPYADTLGLPNSRLIVNHGVPYIKNKNGIFIPHYSTLLTHNPFDEMSIKSWSDIHNSGNYNISIGMYGNIHDKDYAKKRNILEQIASDIKENVVLIHDTSGDEYYYSLNSMRKNKERERVRERTLGR